MAKIYIGTLLPEVRAFPILNSHLGKKPYTGKKAYRAIFDEMDFSFIMLSENPQEADFFLIPYNYFSIKNNKTYIQKFIDLSQKYKKQIVLFAFGDSDEEIMDIPNAVLLRYAGYRHKGLKPNEVIIPTQIYASDILEGSLFFVRQKAEIPTVSFCGWAGFNTLRQNIRYFLDVVLKTAQKYLLFDKHALIYLKGVYWRKKAMRALRHSLLIRTSFLVRNFYSANKNTIQGDPAELRKEYIDNIRHSDFVLVARGDANMAVRFYETLALERIPVLIDTQWLLPLEDEIPYRDFVVFVPHTDIKNTDKYIRKFWDNMTDEEFKERQKLARDTFMKYLKFDSFLKYIFENKLKKT